MRTLAFGSDRTDLGCWHCRHSIPDDNPDCPTCWWRLCSCGACRQPIHRDTRGRIGPCPAEIIRLGAVLRAWSKTFDGQEIQWPTAAELQAGSEVRLWLAGISDEVRLRVRLLTTSGFHPAFGLRLQVPLNIRLLEDRRVPAILRGASNISGGRNVIVETEGGDRLTFVLGDGLFGRIQGGEYENTALQDAAALELLEHEGSAIQKAQS